MCGSKLRYVAVGGGVIVCGLVAVILCSNTLFNSVLKYHTADHHPSFQQEESIPVVQRAQCSCFPITARTSGPQNSSMLHLAHSLLDSLDLVGLFIGHGWACWLGEGDGTGR